MNSKTLSEAIERNAAAQATLATIDQAYRIKELEFMLEHVNAENDKLKRTIDGLSPPEFIRRQAS